MVILLLDGILASSNRLSVVASISLVESRTVYSLTVPFRMNLNNRNTRSLYRRNSSLMTAVVQGPACLAMVRDSIFLNALSTH
jgi:hypothetical protein